MEIHEISFYKQFKCIGGKCSHTCCRGWMIPLTPQDIKRFKHERGKLKLSLCMAISRRDIVCFNKGSGECTFHDADGLCSLQLMKGHEFIPEACRMFPRFYRNYLEFEEHYIDPACIEAARLLLENAADMSLDVFTGDPLSDPCTCNDDTAFLGEMFKTRAAILDRLGRSKDARELNAVLNDIYEYSSKLQSSFLEGRTDFLSDFPFKSFSSEGSLKLFPMETDIFSAIMGTSFFHRRLERTNPFLFKLCRLYFDKYQNLMNDASAWSDASSGFIKEHKEAVQYCTAYYAYYLYLYFLKSYEDYSFLKNAALGMIHTNMVFMFSVLLSLEDPASYPSQMPAIISMYDRRSCFNDEIMNEMYKCLEQL